MPDYTVHIYCSAEQLSAHDNKAGKTLYGLNFTVAVDGTPPQLAAVLPWNWDILGVQYRTSSGWVPCPPADVLDPLPLGSDAQAKASETRYVDQLRSHVANPADFLKMPGGNKDEDGRRLVTAVANLNTRPPQVAQAFKVSRYFYAPPNVQEAAPVLSKANFPDLSPVPGAGANRYEYTKAGAKIQVLLHTLATPPIPAQAAPGQWAIPPHEWTHAIDPAWIQDLRRKVLALYDPGARALQAVAGHEAEFDAVEFETAFAVLSGQSYRTALAKGRLRRNDLDTITKVYATKRQASDAPPDGFGAFWNKISAAADPWRAASDELVARNEAALSLIPTSQFPEAAGKLRPLLHPELPPPPGLVSASGGYVVPPYRASSRPHQFAAPVPGELTADKRTFSGLGLLVRTAAERGVKPAKFTPWRCPNVGRVRLAEKPDESVVPAAVVPLRPSLTTGSQQQVVFYDAQPLSGPGPLGKLSNTPLSPTVTQGEYRQMFSDNMRGVFLYSAVERMTTQPPPKELPENWGARMPDLKFGRMVEAAVFVIPNTGALPPLLAASNPGVLGNFDPGFDARLRSQYQKAVHRELYLRQVPIGLPASSLPSKSDGRAARPADDSRPFLRPEANIAPLERELDREALVPTSELVYFGLSPGRVPGDDLGPAGALDLPVSPGWGLTLDSIDLAVGQRLTITAWNRFEEDSPALSIVVERDAGGVSATAKWTTAAATITVTEPNPGRYVDVRIACDSGKVKAALRSHNSLLLPEAGKEYVSSGQLTIGNLDGARIVIAAHANNGGSVTYRRPRVETGAPAAATAGSAGMVGPRPASNATAPAERPEYFLLASRPVRNDQVNVPASHSIPIRPPRVDIFTWDRWREWKPGDPERQKAWANFFRAGQPGTNLANEQFQEDPAVEGIYLEAVSVYRGTTAAAWPFTRADLQTPLGFDLAVAVNGATDVKTGHIGIRPGEILEVRLYSMVKYSEFFDEKDGQRNQGRIHPDMACGLRTIDSGGVKCVLFGPTAYRFEAAPETALPVIRNLARGILTATSADRTKVPTALRLQLDRTKVDAGKDPDSVWAYVTRADLRIQEWRWLGLPFSPLHSFPFDDLANEDRLADWEEFGGFINRKDVLPHRAAISLDAAYPELYYRDISSDLRALYLRYTVALGHRYSALWPSLDGPGDAPIQSGYVREFVPCRHVKAAPKPRVRLVLPLTQKAEWQEGAPDQSGSPGVLALVAERWYGFGGVNEQLEAEIVSTKDEPDRQPYEGKKYLLEAGEDPILSGAQLLFFAQPGFQITGPVGHTLDGDAEAAIFRACSFVIDMPAGFDAQRWPMMKLRFRRRIDPRGAWAANVDLSSEWTPGVWVQFLPDPLRFFGKADPAAVRVEVRGADLRFNDGAAALRFSDLAPTTRLWAVLMEAIYDVSGNAQERFVGLYAMGADGSTFARFLGSDPVTGMRLRARLVEIQCVPTAVQPTQSNAGTLLFDDTQSAQMRVVGVSAFVPATEPAVRGKQ